MSTEIFKEQQSLFGYRYAGIAKQIHGVETMGGSIIQQVELRHGMFTCFLKVLERTDEFLLLRSGRVTFKILKRDRKKLVNPS